MAISHSQGLAPLRLLVAFVLLGLAGPGAWAQTARPAPASGTAAATTADTRAPSSVRFLKAPSDETPAARARRLKRECKGRPNAGACLGHAS